MDVTRKFREFLKRSIPQIVVKYSSEGKKYDTIEIKRASDMYIAAMLQNDSFLTYPSFSRAVLQAAGLTEEEIQLAGLNKNSIPFEKRDKVVEFARKETVENYVEQNNYYRMLNGLPDLEDIEEYWFEDFGIYEKYNIDPQPLHTIKPDMLVVLETAGYLQPFIDAHPDKKYLQHLGLRRIDIVTARMADNFQLLYFPRFDDSDSFYRDFVNYYEMCREYFLTVIYNNFYTDKYEYYDNYIAFTLLTMVINHMVSGVFKVFISRDFYDAETTIIFLTAYGIPYDKSFSLLELKLLAKNLNILLQRKSTDEVLLDVMSLLGHTDYDLMKYYLVKQQKFDNDGKPYFVYKTEIDENGNEVQVLDKEKMYDFYFSRVEVGTYDIQSAIDNESNYARYDIITEADPYWIEDKELRENLLNSQFNYIDTKYMDVNVIYQMHKIMFEITYLSRMILDKKETKEIEVSLLKLSMDDIPLFDVITFLICLMCRYYGIEPDLMDTATKKLHILGFNFLADFDKIKEDIKARPDLYDQKILNYINNTTFTTTEDINKMYQMVKNLEVFLTTAINNTEDIEAYRAYDKLYRTLLWMECDNRNYADENGNLPKQFTEYLLKNNVELYDKLMNYTREECSDMVDYITTKLMNIFTNTKYLKYMKILDLSAIEALMKLLRFFKSYTVEMKDANIVIMLDSRYYNTIFAREGVDMIAKMYIPDVDFIDDILDLIKGMKSKLKVSEHPRLVHAMKFCIQTLLKTKVDLGSTDRLMSMNADMIVPDILDAYEQLKMHNVITAKQYTHLVDAYKMYITLSGISEKDVYDKLMGMKDINMFIPYTYMMTAVSSELGFNSTVYREDNVKWEDFVKTHVTLTRNQLINLSNDRVGFDDIGIRIYKTIDTYAALMMNNIINYNQYVNLVDSAITQVSLYHDDEISFTNKSKLFEDIAMSIGEECTYNESIHMNNMMMLIKNICTKDRYKFDSTMSTNTTINQINKLAFNSTITRTENFYNHIDVVENMESTLINKDTSTISEKIQFIWEE